MDERLKPVGVGLVAGILSFALPATGTAFIIAAALLAGWVLPREPMVAALLFLVPTAVVGFVRLLIDDISVSGWTLGSAVIAAVMFTAIFTHVGAAFARRRGLARSRRASGG